MTWLTLLLIIKISVTFFGASLPFLLFKPEFVAKTMRLEGHSNLVFKLYGCAVTALLVGYAFGIPAAQNGVFPWGVTWMGTVSNSGAALLLFAHAGQNRMNIVYGLFFAFIAAGLIAAMAMPDLALAVAF